nr:MAG TPA: hypothetical protein [Crassvirales sp.]
MLVLLNIRQFLFLAMLLNFYFLIHLQKFY